MHDLSSNDSRFLCNFGPDEIEGKKAHFFLNWGNNSAIVSLPLRLGIFSANWDFF